MDQCRADYTLEQQTPWASQVPRKCGIPLKMITCRFPLVKRVVATKSARKPSRSYIEIRGMCRLEARTTRAIALWGGSSASWSFASSQVIVVQASYLRGPHPIVVQASRLPVIRVLMAHARLPCGWQLSLAVCGQWTVPPGAAYNPGHHVKHLRLHCAQRRGP